MLNNFAVKILLLSISGSAIALALFAIMPLIKVKLSKTWQYYIWLAVFVRALIPYAPENSIMSSLYRALERNSQILNTAKSIEISGIFGIISNYIGLGWLSITLLLLLKKIISYQVYFRFIKTNRKAITDTSIKQIYHEACKDMGVTRKIGLYTYKMINSPMLIGMFKPYIVLPEAMLQKTDGLKYVLLHELAHYKRKDSLYKWLVQIVSCIHFFNPVIYLTRDTVSKNCELSCDEMVIKKLGYQSKKAYGHALIDALEFGAGHKQPAAVSLMLCEDVNQIKDRLAAISHYRKGSKVIISVSFMLTGFICFSTIYVGVFKNIFASGSCHCFESFTKLFM